MRRAGLLWAVALVFEVHAWGREGHAIVAYVAGDTLSPPAAALARELLDGASLWSVASRMDQQLAEIEARLPGSREWHFENRPVCGKPSRRGVCPEGNCLSHQLPRLAAVLADGTAPHEHRAEALRFLVHLLGDLHQPLHLADNGDAGGNGVWVKAPGLPEPVKLHQLWDRELVKRARAKQRNGAYARELQKRFGDSRAAWQSGDFASWSAESAALGSQVYRALPGFACRWRDPVNLELSPGDVELAGELVPAQLAKAGYRLAAVIERALNG